MVPSCWTRCTRLVGCPDLCSRAWVWDQYDSTIGGQTIKRPGAADAAVVRIEGSLALALALTTDCTPRYCAADPYAWAGCRRWRRRGATSPPPARRRWPSPTTSTSATRRSRHVMGQIAGAMQRHGSAACTGAGLPRRERQRQPVQRDPRCAAILPTPAIGGLGVIAGRRAPPWASRCAPGLGAGGGRAHRRMAGAVAVSAGDRRAARKGPPPPVDLLAERRNGDFVRAQILAGRVAACHDCLGWRAAGGGGGNGAGRAAWGCTSARLPARTWPEHAFWFGEDQGALRAWRWRTRRRLMLDADDGRTSSRPAARRSADGQRGSPSPMASFVEVAALQEAHERFLPEWAAAAP